MITIEYEAQHKLLRMKTGGTSHVYRAARTIVTDDGEIQRPASDMTDAPEIAVELTGSLWEIDGGAKITFSDADFNVRAGADKITPETKLDGYPDEVRAFAETIYGFDPDPDTKEGRYAEIWRLSQLEDEEDTPVTEKVRKPVIKEIGGKLRRVMEEVDEPVEEDVPVYDESGTEVVDTIRRQKMKPGRKVKEKDKQRLAQLRSSEAVSRR